MVEKFRMPDANGVDKGGIPEKSEKENKKSEGLEKHPLYYKIPEIQTYPEVKRAVVRKKRHAGGKISNNSSEWIGDYMDRLENIFFNPDKDKRERNLEMFRDKIYDTLIIKPEVAAREILKDKAKIVLNRGYGSIDITEEIKNQAEIQGQVEDVIKRQKTSLDAWIDYLTENDASYYETWFKYYIWRSITKLQTLVKTEKIDEQTGEKITTAEYPKRNSKTLKPFPDIFRGKISQIYDKYIYREKTDPVVKKYFQKDFAKIYAEESLDYILNYSSESKEQTHGEWVKYRKGNMADAEEMTASLKNKYTDWCIEGKYVGESKLRKGDIYIYNTFNSLGNPVDPRLLIIMNDAHIDEICGISGGKTQEVEQVFMDESGEGVSVLNNKLKEFGNEAGAYKKRETDMKSVTRLMNKNKNDEPFTKDDLVFLYEINSTIEGFGNQKDPRINELLEKRNKEEDMLVVFECTKEEIAHAPNQITKDTKAYVGQLEPGIFQKLPEGIKHVYTLFPENKIRREKVETGSKTVEQLISEMEVDNISISIYAMYMMKNHDFVSSKNREEVTLVHLTVADLGFKTSATTNQIYEQAQTLGLELIPHDTCLNYRLKYQNQPQHEWIRMGMKQIGISGCGPLVFSLGRRRDGLWLDHCWAKPKDKFPLNGRFMFRFRKPESSE